MTTAYRRAVRSLDRLMARMVHVASDAWAEWIDREFERAGMPNIPSQPDWDDERLRVPRHNGEHSSEV